MKEGRREGEGKRERERETGREIECPCVRKEEDGGEREGVRGREIVRLRERN